MITATLRGLLALSLLLVTAPAGLAQPAPAAPTGLQSGVAFSETTPLAGAAELLRRLRGPFEGETVTLSLARAGRSLPPPSVDLGQERFLLYVPAHAPPKGYGLMVYVSPGPRAQLPAGWAEVLDREGMIFVSAERSGNEASVIGRRDPLALLAWANVVKRYPVDPARTYVAGMSGGSRVAMRLALGYPDVFRGALLNAGSDPIGDRSTALPPHDLFLQFQASSRLVYVTGASDTGGLALDTASLRAMHRFCMESVDQRVTPSTGHEVASPEALGQALEILLKPAAPDPAKLEACRAGLDTELASQLKTAQQAVAAGNQDLARSQLLKIDEAWGGYAAPQSLELARACNCGLFTPRAAAPVRKPPKR